MSEKNIFKISSRKFGNNKKINTSLQSKTNFKKADGTQTITYRASKWL
jgi:hypothetical protein